MAWVAPTTRTTGYLVTAAVWNQDVVDDLTFLGASHDHSGDAGDGATIANKIPAGMILPFDQACPTGWTRISAWDGKCVRGSAYPETGGGADTHLHTEPSHTHVVNSHSHAGAAHTHTGPSHTHEQASLGDATDEAETGLFVFAANATSVMFTGTALLARTKMGSGGAAAGTGASGSATADTAAAAGTTAANATVNSSTDSGLPPYVGVVFCKKD